MELYIDAKCDVGRAREHNEDMILFLNEPLRDGKLEYQYSKKLPLSCDILAVCDGMGGANGGEVASKRTVLSLKEYINTFMPRLNGYEQMCDGLRSWQQVIHRQLIDSARTNPELQGMGCTLVGLCFIHGHIFHINCGDSRLYRLRDRTLKQLTRDHSLREELGGDQRVGSNVIINSIGGGERTYMDITEITDTVEMNDLYLLCSDGLSDMLTDEEIATILCRQSTADALIEAANEKGGADNISVCLIQVGYIDPNTDFPPSVQETEKSAEVAEAMPASPAIAPPVTHAIPPLPADRTTVEMDELQETAPILIDFKKVLSEVKHYLNLYQFVCTPQQQPYLEAFAERISDAYPQVSDAKALAELVLNALLANALKRHIQTGGFGGLKKISALKTLDDADFIAFSPLP